MGHVVPAEEAAFTLQKVPAVQGLDPAGTVHVVGVPLQVPTA